MGYHPDLQDRGKELTEAILGVLMEHELVIEYDNKGILRDHPVPVKYTIRKRGGGKTE